MTVATETMIDTVGTDVSNVPSTAPRVQAYVTGIDGVMWSPSQISQWPTDRVFRMAQNGGPAPDPRSYHGLDVENRAYTPQEAAQQVDVRVGLGIPWTTIYGGDAALRDTAAAIQAYGSGIWIGHVDCILADWNLDEAEAAALVGTFIHGMTCVGVQWASPSSNPNTILPGTNRTLSETNCDLNVVAASWRPDIFNQLPPPPPPPPTMYHGVVVTVDGGGVFSARQVSSTDDTHWQ